MDRSEQVRRLIKDGKLVKDMTLNNVLNLLGCPKNVYQTRAKYIWTWGNVNFHFSRKKKLQDSILLKIEEVLL